MFKEIEEFNKQLAIIANKHERYYDVDTFKYEFNLQLITQRMESYIVIRMYKNVTEITEFEDGEVDECEYTLKFNVLLYFDKKGNFTHRENIEQDKDFTLEEVEHNLHINHLIDDILHLFE